MKSDNTAVNKTVLPVRYVYPDVCDKNPKQTDPKTTPFPKNKSFKWEWYKKTDASKENSIQKNQ